MRMLSLSVAYLALLAVRLFAAEPKAADLRAAWGDQGDGTFVNPILPGDFSDLDVIRVGDQYVAISSTLHLAPGMLVLTSADLVNWKFASHAVSDVTQLGPDMNWDKMNRYGRGVWAGAIRFHVGQYWVYFGTPDEGLFVTSAPDPSGPWSSVVQVFAAEGWDDPCPLWDDDGQGYLVATNFGADPTTGKKYNIHLFKLSADGKSLVSGFDRILYQSRGSEANKLYKWNGEYYHYFSQVTAEGRVPMMRRAKSLDGPWETRQLLHVHRSTDREPNQGGIVEGPRGDWWFLTHAGSGEWDGRTMQLLPVTWKDGWPVPGAIGADGIGNMIWKHQKPVPESTRRAPPGSDDFASETLAPQWEWNHAPRDDKWSLTERSGCLRLHAFKPLRPGDLLRTGNVLSQRAYRTAANEVVVTVDLAGMADGQEAGLCHFGSTFASIGVVQNRGARTLFFREGTVRSEGDLVTASTVYLRSAWGIDGVSRFAYSVDGAAYIPLGTAYQLTWGSYRGDRVGVYTFNDVAEQGYLDVDAFHYTLASPDAKP